MRSKRHIQSTNQQQHKHSSQMHNTFSKIVHILGYELSRQKFKLEHVANTCSSLLTKHTHPCATAVPSRVAGRAAALGR